MARCSGETFVDAPAPLSPGCNKKADDETSSQGFSILKEIFPEHGKEENSAKGSRTKPAQQPSLEQLLNTMPSPARASWGNCGPQPNSVPCNGQLAPGVVQPTSPGPIGIPPAMPLPVGPPILPVPSHQDRCAQAMPHQAVVAPHFQDPSAGMSYRERLRAGGRGAFQRAFDAGLMPRNMKQDWNMPPQEMQHGMSYSMGDSQQMWNGMQQMPCNDFAAPGQYQGMPQVMPQPQEVHMLPQLPQMPMGEPPMPTGQEMQLQPMLTPTSSSHTTPFDTPRSTENDRLMAIVMPQSSAFFPTDKDMLAAQLQATADCQCYED